ncbi:ATP-dependent DNA helicase [Helicobacter sp. 12S02232-10]|uniref:ATP-dependent helicase n=1 Tax=Helicobacter sp. 12S02232-10 TaxID=1476197 RepID=UPI000BA59456|nr:ATP-dependent helicase [Helicobacter sp. 12S02232-10]PAF48315.1 ATP-dependent DNA helicase [Helicobacter sp. 12S02232-10]
MNVQKGLNLNAEQKQAAMAPKGHNLVIASAGTGKTSTIVGRIAHLLDSGIDPKEILLLTFTNKASLEMIERVSKIFGEKEAKQIESGTFHAVAYRYLKEHLKISLKQPRELKVLFKSIAEHRIYANKGTASPYSAQYLYDIHSLYLNSQKEQSFEEWLKQKSPEQALYIPVYEGILDEFQALKKEYGYADYNDLLIMYRDEMSKQESPYQEVLCDEYQDTNPLQDSLIDAINPESLFCVGDYDQSIYAFNGADISIISNFTTKYKDAHVFTLKKNYRSSYPILDLANRIIQKNERIYEKSLEVVKTGEYSPPKLLAYEELFLQYQGIAKKIATSNYNLDDIAVIFRNNASADGCEASLREMGIPSRRKGGISFFDTKEVSLMLDICSLIYNPKDMMAHIHTLSYGSGIGNSIAKDIYEALNILGNRDTKTGLLAPDFNIKPYASRSKNTQLGLFDDFFALQNSARFDTFLPKDFCSHPILSHPKLTKEGAVFLGKFFIMYQRIYSLSSPFDLITTIAKSEFFRHIIEILGRERSKNKDGTFDENRRIEAMEKIDRKITLLSDLAKNYRDIGRFLNAMILGSNEASEGSGVNLLSVHASKGLEFRDVYIIDLMDGRFPNRKLISKGGSIEEERRLFYVAITRAKENLYLSYAKKDAVKNIDYEPSIFLYEANMLKPKNLNV